MSRERHDKKREGDEDGLKYLRENVVTEVDDSICSCATLESTAISSTEMQTVQAYLSTSTRKWKLANLLGNFLKRKKDLFFYRISIFFQYITQVFFQKYAKMSRMSNISCLVVGQMSDLSSG